MFTGYICIFIIYSFLGWVYESILCTVMYGKWDNRGFLYGPVCPIYGTGALIIILLAEACERSGFAMNPAMFFLFAVVGSAFLEYGTSWVLEKMFHALWWDYSNLPLNLHGRISLFTSLGFGVAGLVIVYGLMPITRALMALLPPVVTELLGLLFVATIAADITLTVTALHHFDQLVIGFEDNFNRNMEHFVDEKFQQSNRLKQEITEKGHEILTHMNSFNGLVRGSISKIRTVRVKDGQKESVRGQLIEAIRNGLPRL